MPLLPLLIKFALFVNIESLLAVTFLHQDLPYILIAANARDGYPFTEAHLALLVELVADKE